MKQETLRENNANFAVELRTTGNIKTKFQRTDNLGGRH